MTTAPQTKITGAVKFGDYVGVSDPAPNDLAKFVRAWFRPDDHVLIAGFMAPGRTPEDGRTTREFLSYSVEELTANYSAVFTEGRQGARDIYFRFTPAKDPALVKYNSPGENNAGRPLGLWVDLDVKPHAFNSQQDILAWLDQLPLMPTAIVRNGESGGIHAYWRVHDSDLPRLTVDSEHMAMWWSYLQAQAPTNAHGERIQIDQLTDIGTRLARLPGMTYWPKSSEAKIGTVALAGGTYEPVLLDDVQRLAEVTYAEHQERKAVVRRMARSTEKRLDRELTPLKRLALERAVNQLSWDEILLPHGWTVQSSHSGTTRYWTRPGSKQKSASTDYTRDDGQVSDVMSLYSGAEETNLLDLKLAGTPLTKMRVLLRLSYADNVSALLQDYIKSSDTSLGGNMSEKEINYYENPTQE